MTLLLIFSSFAQLCVLQVEEVIVQTHVQHNIQTLTSEVQDSTNEV